VSELLTAYEDFLKNEKQESANTVSSYLRDVHQFAEAMRGKDVPMVQVAARDVEDYANSLTKRGKSPATVTRSMASIKSFYTCMVDKGHVDQNPAKGVSPAKVERKLPQVLTGKEVELFLEQPECTDPKGYRDRAMLELLYATGIRVSELIDLDVDDLNLPGGVLRCYSKGRERVIPLYPAAIRALNQQDRPIVFILWGRPAQMKEKMLNNPKHLILKAAHPSPLSAHNGFFGSRPFSQTNRFLEENGLEPIDWQIENA